MWNLLGVVNSSVVIVTVKMLLSVGKLCEANV